MKRTITLICDTSPLNPRDVTVCIDGLTIGCLQDFSIHLNVNGAAEISATFPNLKCSSDLMFTPFFQEGLARLHSVGANISFEEAITSPELREIGTDGVIDSVEMNSEIQ